MGKSQFDPELKLPPNVAQVSEAERTLNVGGPLNIAAPEEYEHPIHIRFQVVQVPRGEHDENAVKRVRGRGEEVIGEKRWHGTVKLGELVTGRASDTQIETRGVAIAVLERSDQFAFDTITWCDEVALLDSTPAAPSEP